MKKTESISSQLNQLLADSKNRSYFVGFITFAFLSLFVVFGIIPVYSSILSQIEENKKIEDATQIASRKLETFQSMTVQQESNSDVLTYLDYILPSSNTQEDIAEFLINLGVDNDITIDSIEFKRDPVSFSEDRIVPLVSVNIVPYSISFLARGTREDIITFVQLIEQSRRIMDIENMNMSNEVNENNSYTLTIQLRYYTSPGLT